MYFQGELHKPVPMDHQQFQEGLTEAMSHITQPVSFANFSYSLRKTRFQQVKFNFASLYSVPTGNTLYPCLLVCKLKERHQMSALYSHTEFIMPIGSFFKQYSSNLHVINALIIMSLYC